MKVSKIIKFRKTFTGFFCLLRLFTVRLVCENETLEVSTMGHEQKSSKTFDFYLLARLTSFPESKRLNDDLKTSERRLCLSDEISV